MRTTGRTLAARATLLTLVAGLATACATKCPDNRPCYGRSIEGEQVRAIEAGVTTAGDVSRILGEPADLRIATDRSETWVYRYRSTLHRFDDPDERCAVLGRTRFLGWLFRAAAYAGLLACVESQTEAELRVDLDPHGVVRACEFVIQELPVPPLGPLPDPRRGPP